MKVQVTSRKPIVVTQKPVGEGIPAVIVEGPLYEPDITASAREVEDCGFAGKSLCRAIIEHADGTRAIAFLTIRINKGRPQFLLDVKVNGEDRDQVQRTAFAGWRPPVRGGP